MIHDIGRDLQAKLRKDGLAIAVVDGPEPAETSTWGRERIVIEHDSAGDKFSTPRGAHVNPNHRRTRTASYKLTIYVQSNVTSPTIFEHKIRAERVLHMVLCAMDYVAAVRKNHWDPSTGRFVVPVDLEKSEKQGGAVYELAFTFDQAVAARTWAGLAKPEYSVGPGGVRSTTRVSSAHGPDDDNDPQTVPASAETSCGN